MTTLHLTLLGTPQIQLVEDGEETAVTEFASFKVQAILFYLAHSKQPCPREKLIGLLWPDVPTDNARTSLRSALYNLQKKCPDVLSVNRKTVAIGAECTLLTDVARFCAAVATDDLTDLRTAVSLYRGEFLDGFTIEDAPEFEYWRVLEKERLHQQMLDSLQKLITHDMQTNLLSDAILNLRRLLKLEPWREEAHRQLMDTLARAGQFNEALRQYDQCVQILEAEFGLPPMPETEKIAERIRHLRQNPPPSNLPTIHSLFVGREAELAELQQQLADPNCRLLTILGPGGVGKSRLALQTAVSQSTQFLDGRFFVNLAGIQQSDQIATSIGEAMHLPFSGRLPHREQLLTYLQSKECLLICDNFEHLLGGAGLLVDILQTAPNIQLIVTSRERLRLRAEWVFSLDGLPTPPQTDYKPMAQYESVQLLQSHAQRVDRNFALADVETAVAEICRMVVGMPLALELAGSMVWQQTPAQIIEALTQNLDHIASDWRDVPSRHRSLRAVFQSSWDLLTESEQKLLAQLTIFQDGFTAAAAHEVATATNQSLQSLVDKSLLQRDENGRFALHPLIRQYAQENLTELEAIRYQHATYFAQYSAKWTETLQGIEQLKAIGRLGQEHQNILYGWQWSIEQAQYNLIAQMAFGLFEYFNMRSWLQEGLASFETAVTKLTPHTEDERLTVAEIETFRDVLRARLGQARSLDETAITMRAKQFQATKRGQFANFNFGLLATMAWFSGDYATAIEQWQVALDIAREHQAWARIAATLNNLSVGVRQIGELQQAHAYSEEAVQIARQHTNPWTEARCLLNLGAILNMQDQPLPSIDIYQQSYDLFAQFEDHEGMASALNGIGVGCNISGNYEQAIPYLQKCMHEREILGQPHNIAVAQSNLAKSYTGLAAYAEAESLLRPALQTFRERNILWSQANTSILLGELYLKMGKRDEAKVALSDALATAVSADTIHLAIDALFALQSFFSKEKQRNTLAFIATTPRAKAIDQIKAEDLLQQQFTPDEIEAAKTAVRGKTLEQITVKLHQH